LDVLVQAELIDVSVEDESDSVGEFELYEVSVDVDSSTLVSTLDFVGATADVEAPRPKAKQRPQPTGPRPKVKQQRQRQPTGPLHQSPWLAANKSMAFN
jgi:hypothetical protein